MSELITTSLYPNAPTGSTANSLALTPDGKTLYVANADNNCLAVFDVSAKGKSRSEGFIPTGWYPTSVRVANEQVYVANGKGNTGSMANPKGPDPVTRRTPETQYIGGLFKGSLSIIPQPDAIDIVNYTRWVYENTPYTKEKELHAEGEFGNPIPMEVGKPSPIKYVFTLSRKTAPTTRSSEICRRAMATRRCACSRIR